MSFRRFSAILLLVGGLEVLAFALDPVHEKDKRQEQKAPPPKPDPPKQASPPDRIERKKERQQERNKELDRRLNQPKK